MFLGCGAEQEVSMANFRGVIAGYYGMKLLSFKISLLWGMCQVVQPLRSTSSNSALKTLEHGSGHENRIEKRLFKRMMLKDIYKWFVNKENNSNLL